MLMRISPRLIARCSGGGKFGKCAFLASLLFAAVSPNANSASAIPASESEILGVFKVPWGKAAGPSVGWLSLNHPVTLKLAAAL